MMTGEENTGLSIFLGVIFILWPAFFFFCVKIDPPDDQNQDIFFLASVTIKFHKFNKCEKCEINSMRKFVGLQSVESCYSYVKLTEFVGKIKVKIKF